MTVRDSMADLERRLMELDETLGELTLIAGDVPVADDEEPAVVEALCERATDIRGRIAEAASTARSATAADRRAAARALATAHCTFNELARRVRVELASPANFAEVAAVAAERGGAWTRWSRALQQAVESAAAATEPVTATLVDCWRELVEQQTTPA